jgi:hypothetical protein
VETDRYLASRLNNKSKKSLGSEFFNKITSEIQFENYKFYEFLARFLVFLKIFQQQIYKEVRPQNVIRTRVELKLLAADHLYKAGAPTLFRIQRAKPPGLIFGRRVSPIMSTSGISSHTNQEGKASQLRIKLAQIRLQRMEVQRKRWRVAELQRKWMQVHQGIELQRNSVAERRASVSSLNSHFMKQLDAMSQMNAMNDCFYIWHSGPFATINNFRLGRLPVETVEWSEINAALGQVALLLSTIEHETPMTFSYELFPKGSQSQIAKLPDARGTQQIYNLYTDGGGFSVFQMRNNSFHKGLELLLAVVAEAGSFIETQNPAFKLPYAIERSGSKIAGISIVVGQASDELWTRALKYMLTDLKWIVAWAAGASQSS